MKGIPWRARVAISHLAFRGAALPILQVIIPLGSVDLSLADDRTSAESGPAGCGGDRNAAGDPDIEGLLHPNLWLGGDTIDRESPFLDGAGARRNRGSWADAVDGHTER
jgi:hypothetical protein